MNILKTFRDASNKLTPGNDLPTWFLDNKLKRGIVSSNKVEVFPVNTKMVSCPFLGKVK